MLSVDILLRGEIMPSTEATGARLPWPLNRYVERAMLDFLTPGDGPAADFTEPKGEAALVPPQSVSWRIFKNPLTVFIGGVAAVILELAEPRIRTGVWDHTSFRTNPLLRLKRTGLAAMITVYGPRSVAEAMTARVRGLHERIAGVTPSGRSYRASEPELLDWVHATAAFGFAEAYHAYVRRLSPAERDRLLTEGLEAASLYGATGAPGTAADLESVFVRMRPSLESSDVVFSFLDIMRRTRIFPTPAGVLQGPLIKAAVAIIPDWARTILGLGSAWTLNRAELAVVSGAARAADRIVLEGSPAAQSCRRLGLPEDWLWRPW
jgi:uncharacterized protein (DUF2236 family)